MNVIAVRTIREYENKYPDIMDPLRAWLKEAEKADWDSPQDIKDRYKSASFLSNNIVIFNIKGNTYRLVVKVAYLQKTVYIKWFGTHAEYDKETF